MKFRLPRPETLAKYGLTGKEWRKILRAQGGVCPICRKFPPSGRLVTDHEHVAGWRSFPPERRKLFVRGITCWTCNRYFLSRGMTEERALHLNQYLRSYRTRSEPPTA
jgi:hypothetical protein